MASPQIEEGFTKIANELLEAFARTNFSAYQRRVIDVIIRKTYGYRKKSDYIAISQIVEMTQIHKANISRALKELNHRNIVVRSGNQIGLNKDWQTWEKLSNEITPKLSNQITSELSNEITTPSKKVIYPDAKVISSDSKKLSGQTDTKERKKLTKEKNPVPGSYFPSKKEVNLVENYCKTLGVYFKKNFWPWIQSQIKKKYRADAIIFALGQLWEYRESTKDPWPYLNQIIVIEHQNLNEAEHMAEHEKLKQEETDGSIPEFFK